MLKKIRQTTKDVASSSLEKVKKPFRKKAPEVPSRITTENLSEHREAVIAGGRKFKYPIQYARHRLVFNTILIVLAVLIVVVATVWFSLYRLQTSNDLMYRVTRAVPLPVASVDGQSVRYSDYLMRYRSSLHYKEEKEQIDLNSDSDKSQLGYIKRQELDNAEADAYAAKLAKQLKITVSNAELNDFLKAQRQSPSGEVSENTYNAVILDYYGWTPDEYARVMKEKLIHQKVAYAVDKDATAAVKTAKSMLKSGTSDLNSVATALNQVKAGVAEFGSSGAVPKTNQDGGLATTASKMSIGEISGPVKVTTGDGYYFIKLTGLTDSSVTYDFVHIKLTDFDAQLAKIKASGKIREYIKVEDN